MRGISDGLVMAGLQSGELQWKYIYAVAHICIQREIARGGGFTECVCVREKERGRDGNTEGWRRG